MDQQDEAQFEAFVIAHGRALLRTAFLMVGDHGHAEDLVQTALERTARRPGEKAHHDLTCPVR